MSNRVENVNSEMLRVCREQVALRLDGEEMKNFRWVGAAEEGQKKPTFKQLENLANLYGVPSWVFISESLPEEYQFSKAMPEFRRFADSDAKEVDTYKVRVISAKVARLRNLILELREDMKEPVAVFSPPKIDQRSSPEQAAQQARRWLGVDDHESFSLKQWREKVESRDVFVFLTSKYRGWAHLGKEAQFRGLSIYEATLPIIIINNSDAKKAQSFTLFHELGHLLLGESAMHHFGEYDHPTEKWCDKFAGSVLMPEERFREAATAVKDFESIALLARKFQVSVHACIVRLSQLEIIGATKYREFERRREGENRRMQEKSRTSEWQREEDTRRVREKLRTSSGRSARNRPKEVLEQYGRIYSTAVLDAYHSNEIGLSKLCQLLDLKRVSHAMALGSEL